MKTITPALKLALKKPMGTLFRSSAKERAKLKAELTGAGPDHPGQRQNGKVYAVGDATVQALFKLGIAPHIRIFDLKTRRKPLPPKQAAFFDTLYGEKMAAVNPAGHITPSLEKAITKAVASPKPVDLFVIGEEDLAVIPLLREAKEGKICYGQPLKGLVVIDVNAESKTKAEELYRKFRTVRN
ncbi:GTP-dependent dephospho-CoA kinase family protein [Candidatus Micrarchaeota archaeon]|nr:GTP-dependent dephospho-CoA kinase family protein [Candidatus Micrarchaeota archaeon]